MILYATIESERAEKGQGGKYLDIYVSGQKKEELCNMHISQDQANTDIYFLEIHQGKKITKIELKGNQQKDDFVRCECGQKIDHISPCNKCDVCGNVDCKNHDCIPL